MKQKILKIIRILTVAPFMCLISTFLILIFKREYFVSINSIISAIFNLTILPLSSYPVYYLVKPLKNKGRSFQRLLTIIFAMLGYIFAFSFSFILKDTKEIKIYYFTYLLSSLILLAFRLFNKINPSGHAAGISGPITFLVIYINKYFAFLYCLTLIIWYASVKMKRHTNLEYIIGTFIPIIILISTLFI